MKKQAGLNAKSKQPAPQSFDEKSSLSSGAPLLTQGKRLISLDALRGLLMILMAIDHANYFIARQHPIGEFWGISPPQYKSLGGFLTRFVTHPCAPGFFFLMGVSMVLFADSRRHLGWSEGKILRYFIFRGILLIVMQQFLENPAWLLGPFYKIKPPGGGEMVWFHFGVLFGLGASMIVAALLFRLRPTMLLIISLIAIIATQLFIPDPSKSDYLYSPLLRLILIPGQSGTMQVFYSILPWFGFVGFGLAFGRWLLSDSFRSYRKALGIGIAFIFLFVLVRIIGSFGNIHPPNSSGLISFLNVTKYPPSIAFILLTMGATLLLLVLFSRTGEGFERWGKFLLIFGSSALFFYIVHLYLFALVGIAVASEKGTSFLLMYVFWFVGLVLLYPMCRWYGNFKKRKPADSIWRLF